MPNSFDLATGYVTFKGSFEQYEKDIQAAEEKLSNLNKGLKNGSFKMAAYAAKSINTELEKAQKNAKRMMDEVRLGKMGVLFRDAAAGMKTFQDRMMRLGGAGVGVGAAAVGMASVASPLAADTLSGSIKLLTASVGREFVPAVIQLSFAIQDATKWWNQLSPAVKQSTAETVKMVAMAGGAALALGGVSKMLSLIAAHPFVAAAGAGIAAGAFIGRDMANDRDKRIGAAKNDLAGLGRDEILNDGRMQQLRRMPNGLEQAKKDFSEMWVKNNEAVDRLDKFNANPVFQAIDFFRGGAGQKKLIENAAHQVAEFDKSKTRWDALQRERGQSGLPGKRSPIDAIPGGAAGMAAGKNGGGNLLGSMGPSSYSSLQDFYRSFNVAATSGSPLEAEVLKIQMQTRDAILEQTKVINDKLGKSS